MDKKAIVFIDGANFYFKLKYLTSEFSGRYNLINFNFRKFSEWLVCPNKLVDIRYYLGAIKQGKNNSKGKKLYANQQKFFSKLYQQNISIVLGKVIRYPNNIYHEKGVDVRLAVEMIRFAREQRYDIAYLLSSDTDIVPAVEEVRAVNRKVQYVGTAKGQSWGLSKNCDDVRLLRPEDIKGFFKI